MRSFLASRRSHAELGETSKMKQNVEYAAPPAYVLESFALQVCRGLGGKYADREIERGFADFMVLVSRILANNLNRDPRLQAEPTPESSDRKLDVLE
jgi:hypothetical protein